MRLSKANATVSGVSRKGAIVVVAVVAAAVVALVLVGVSGESLKLPLLLQLLLPESLQLLGLRFKLLALRSDERMLLARDG